MLKTSKCLTLHIVCNRAWLIGVWETGRTRRKRQLQRGYLERELRAVTTKKAILRDEGIKPTAISCREIVNELAYTWQGVLYFRFSCWEILKSNVRENGTSIARNWAREQYI